MYTSTEGVAGVTGVHIKGLPGMGAALRPRWLKANAVITSASRSNHLTR
ncbi:hypothetical protein STRIP9103_05292 [Streptomyces ipomoeae 91-03]|uniref:Uncharacterized protein n=1 Tax=Streptomyces ipomoeae 91-03 TaxID=698759 RepID=L1L8K0_9ACTN|nr:hypothetical protein STRIP9103_05292 [Streptomyces ipomoeae 91-03]